MTDIEDLTSELQRQGITAEEARGIIKQLRHPRVERGKTTSRDYGKHFKIGVISDLHIGHSLYRPDILDHAIKTFNREGIDEVYLPGDIIEGMSNRDGHIYELAEAGVTGQVALAKQELGRIRQPISAILGNHDLWSMKKANQGVNIGQELSAGIKGFRYLGDMSADIDLGTTTIRLSHEGNSVATGISYSLQKRINALSGGEKPGVILNGHLHKMLYAFYRNIHAFECGTLCDQTEFMRMKGSPAHTGYLTLDIKHGKAGITQCTPTFYPFYQ